MSRTLVLCCALICMTDIILGEVPSMKLNDHTKIPAFGLGTWLRGSTAEKTKAAVEAAIDYGYRHIDTAAIYGTEPHVGQAVENKIKDGIVKREDLYITTKLWNTKHAPQDVIPALRESLENLKMDYVDLYLIHFPVSYNSTESSKPDEGNFTDIDYVDTWRAMIEAQKLGLTKSIGVSNFNTSQLARMIKETGVKPACNQVEVNPNLTQKKLIAFCKEHGIQVVAYTPLGSMSASRSKEDSPAPRLDDPVLQKIGDKYGKSTVQVVLRYHIDNGLIPIPKSSTPSRIKDNIDVFDFKLTEDEIKSIDDFNMNYRCVPVTFWKDHKYFPFHETE